VAGAVYFPGISAICRRENYGLSRLFGCFALRTGLFQLIEIHHINIKSKIWRGLAVSGHQLVLVAVQIKVKWVFGRRINQQEIGIGHEQLSKLQLVAAIRHIVLRRYLDPWIFPWLTEDLNNVVAVQMNVSDLAGNLWRRKNLGRIENQVVFFHLYAAHLAIFDQAGDVDSKEVDRK